jgi:hypothetical protein
MGDNGYSSRAISDDELHSARHMRHKLLQDPYRPLYHFVAPEGHAMPFDPNGNVFWRGRHHMGYIYQERGVHFWGHVSSTDLLHWRHHSANLLPTSDSPEQGVFSGNSFVDRDGSRVLCLYHGVDAVTAWPGATTPTWRPGTSWRATRSSPTRPSRTRSTTPRGIRAGRSSAAPTTRSSAARRTPSGSPKTCGAGPGAARSWPARTPASTPRRTSPVRISTPWAENG